MVDGILVVQYIRAICAHILKIRISFKTSILNLLI